MREDRLFVWMQRKSLNLIQIVQSNKTSWKAQKLRNEGRMNEGWMKNDEEWWRMKDEGWRMMISSCWEVLLMDGQTDRQTDICYCRVAFATENDVNAI